MGAEFERLAGLLREAGVPEEELPRVAAEVARRAMTRVIESPPDCTCGCPLSAHDEDGCDWCRSDGRPPCPHYEPEPSDGQEQST